MMEKYNVTAINLEAGGGEYLLKDGFGWTNGVSLVLKKEFEKIKIISMRLLFVFPSRESFYMEVYKAFDL